MGNFGWEGWIAGGRVKLVGFLLGSRCSFEDFFPNNIDRARAEGVDPPLAATI